MGFHELILNKLFLEDYYITLQSIVSRRLTLLGRGGYFGFVFSFYRIF